MARPYQSERNQAESLGTHLYKPPFFSKSPWSRLDSFILQLRKLQTNSWWVPSPMPFPQVHNLSRQGLDQGFSTMALLTFWVGSFFILEEGLVHRRSMGSQRARRDWATEQQQSCIPKIRASKKQFAGGQISRNTKNKCLIYLFCKLALGDFL